MTGCRALAPYLVTVAVLAILNIQLDLTSLAAVPFPRGPGHPVQIGATRRLVGQRASRRPYQYDAAAAARRVADLLPPQSFPECESEAVVTKRWNLADGVYSQARCREEHRRLRSMLEALAIFFETQRIEWFFEGGSLLGVERHSGSIIPWDGDIDLCVVVYRYSAHEQGLSGVEDTDAEPLLPQQQQQQQEEQAEVGDDDAHLLTLRNFVDRLLAFRDFGGPRFTMRSCAFGDDGLCTTAFKVHEPHQEIDSKGLFVEGPHIDIQPVLVTHDGSAVRYLNAFWGGRQFRTQDVLPTRRCEWYGTDLGRCPRDTPLVLTRFFGRDFMLAADTGKVAATAAAAAGVTAATANATTRKPIVNAGSSATPSLVDPGMLPQAPQRSS